MQSNGVHAQYRSVKHFANLDGLRFICIAMVVWHHANPIDLPNIQLENRGFLGVDFFFVLSGYLITTLLLREASTYGDFSLRDFYLRRMIRIFPVYYFVVTMVAFYYIVIDGQRHFLDLLPYYYLFLSNFLVGDIPTLAPTWSLSVEEQYYLIWPLLLLLLPKKWVIPALSLLIAVNVISLTGWVWVPDAVAAGPLLFQMPNPTYAPILMGSLAAVILHNKSLFERVWPFVSHGSAPIIGIVLLIAAMEFSPGDLRGIPNFVVHSLMTYVIVTLVAQERNPLSPFFTNRLISRIGAISYGIYLYHLLALDVANRTLSFLGIQTPWLVLIFYSILSCIIAEVSFRTLESYFRRFRPQPRSIKEDAV